MKSTFTVKLFQSRAIRIISMLGTFFIIREASLRMNGFQNGPTLCPIRLLTGFPCPGCGATRSIGALCLGEFQQAWLFNPLGFLLFAIAIMWALKLEVMNRAWDFILNAFRSKSLLFQVSILVSLYFAAWIGALSRFNSGIL